jgi:acyl-CoA hydrolase
MHFAVDVWSRDPRLHEIAKTTHCVIIFVALDDEGNPTPVPEWKPSDPNDVALEQYAQKLMELRRGIEEEMGRYLSE